MIHQLAVGVLAAALVTGGGPPLAVTPVQSSYALPRGADPDAVRAALSRADPEANPASDRVRKAIYAWGGADLGSSTRYVTLTASLQLMTVVGVRAVVRRRRPVLGGTRIEFTAEAWGINTPDKVRLVLDDPRPAAVTRFTVAPGHALTIEVWATLSRQTVDWELVLDVVAGGRSRSVRLPSPLRTTARAGAYRAQMTVPR